MMILWPLLENSKMNYAIEYPHMKKAVGHTQSLAAQLSNELHRARAKGGMVNHNGLTTQISQPSHLASSWRGSTAYLDRG